MYQFIIATKNTRIVRFCNVNALMHGLVGSFISLMHINFLVSVLFIKQQNYVTVLCSYKKHYRIVRFTNGNAVMHINAQ